MEQNYNYTDKLGKKQSYFGTQEAANAYAQKQGWTTSYSALGNAGITAPLGSQEATNQLLAKSKELLSQPIDVTDLKNGTGLKVPNSTGSTPDLYNAKSTTEFLRIKSEQDQKKADEAKAEADALKAKTQQEEQSWLSKIFSQKTTEQKREEEYAEAGINVSDYIAQRNADIASLDSLYSTYDSVSAQIDKQVNQILSNAGGSQNFLSGQEARIRREGNAKLSAISGTINSKLAIMTAKDQSFTTAKQFADQAVDDYTYDLKTDLENFKLLKENNAAALADLDKEYTDALDSAENAKFQELTIKEAELKTVLDLAIQYPDAPWPTDLSKLTPAEAAQIAGQRGPELTQNVITNADGSQDLISYDNQGNVMNRVSVSGATPIPTPIPADTLSVDAWVDLLAKGQTQIYNIPLNIRNEVVTRAAEKGIQILSPTFAKASADAQSSFNAANSQLNLIDNATKDVITATTLYGLAGQTISNIISKTPLVGAILQPKFKIFNDSVNAFVSMLTRAAGEKGVLTDVDVARVRKALPNTDDTVETATQKMNNFRGLLEAIKSGAADAYSAQQFGLTIKSGTGSTVSGGTNNNDPMGLGL